MGKGAEIKLRRALAAGISLPSKPAARVIGKRKNQRKNFQFRSQPSKSQRTEFISQGKQVFVSNLAWDSRRTDLKTICEKYGEVVRVTLQRKEDGLSKGTALVLFKRRESAQKCIEGLPGTDLDGRKLFCHMDKHEGKPTPGNEKRVFVGNLPFFVNWATLKQVWWKYGNCRADLATDDKGRSKGYGIVTFQQKNSAYDCVRELHGQVFLGRRIMVKFDNRAHFVSGPEKKEVPTKQELDHEMESYQGDNNKETAD
jgi:RNA recognition motif-containing protein